MKRIIGILLVFILIGGIFLGVTLNSQSSGYTLTVNDLSRTGLKENSVVTITAPEKEGYIFSNWEIVSGEAVLENAMSMTTTFSMPGGDLNIKANYILIEEPANAPILGEGMKPVNWDNTYNEWVEVSESNWDYNYKSVAEEVSNGTVEGNGSGKWANSITDDGSMWVWIPRYTYKIESGYHQKVNSWNSDLVDGTEETLGKISVKFSDGIEDDTEDGYILHPAFTFGEDELEGFWVAKYEASRADATGSNSGESSQIKIAPGVISAYNMSVSEIYDLAYNYSRELDSHLIKNSEWGAVAYLTNARGRIPYINNSSNTITGNAGASEDSEYVSTIANMWNTPDGVKGSTTHNVYGIYDLSGGSREYVSAYWTGGKSSYLTNDTESKLYAGTLYKNRNSKYVETYDSVLDSSIKGDAVYETSGNGSYSGWDNDYSISSSGDGFVFTRGGGYDVTSGGGPFYFNMALGESARARGFRPVLIGFNNEDTYTVSYDANGGTGAPASQTKVEGVELTLSSTTPTWTGHIFLGWSTNRASEKPEYKAGDKYNVDANTTLYAVWDLDAVITLNWSTEGTLTKSITVKTTGTTQISWGDGMVEAVNSSPGTELTLTHAYAQEGNYDVKLVDNVVTYLSCANNNINNLDINKNTQLEYLDVSNNELENVDVSNNVALRTLLCRNNYLDEELNLANNSNLTTLDCSNTGIDSLYLDNNPQLTYLDCNGNSLATLDISNNLALTELYCGGNELPILNIGANEQLSKVCCTQECMTQLYISMAQNTNMNIIDEDSWCNGSDVTTSNAIHKYGATNVVVDGLVAFNVPELGIGMTPVNWDTTSNEWVETDAAHWDYNYNSVAEEVSNGTVVGNGAGKWANAKTNDGSMWVWIPRYTYKIISGDHQSAVSWNSDLYNEETDTAGKIEIKFSIGTVDDTSGGYIAHPAFTFGEDELEGFWVAKYEASRSDATDTSEGSSTTPKFIPGVVSYRNTSVSSLYEVSYNYNRELDSHLMKNSEWGAVAYLTNAIGRIPYINNSSTFITGNAGATQDAASAEGVTNTWNTVAGVKGSTTHNVYGIYDLSGAGFEYVAAYYESGNSEFLANDVISKTYAGSLYKNKDTKYVEIYGAAYSNEDLGDAGYETSNGNPGLGWDNDYISAPSFDSPVFARGGDYASIYNGGIFYVYNYIGNSWVNRSFRTVLVGFNNIDTYTITYEANGGSGAPEPVTKTENETITLSTIHPMRNGYRFLGWSTNNTATEAEYLPGADFSVDANITLYAVWGFDANIPLLGTGMTPVNWDTTSNNWVETDAAHWDYNYDSVAEEVSNGTVEGNGSGKWANAKTNDGSMWVWIPRYTYKIVSGEHQSAVSWNSDLYNEETDTAGKIEIEFSVGTDDYTDNGYIVHPAFTFGEDELEGFWVAKYEASRSDATESGHGTSDVITSKPGVKVLLNESVSTMYEYGYNYNRTLDSHMMKNSEWGAVAYLTNAIGRIPYINNGYITGLSGESEGATEGGTTHSWNTAGGVKASTTHNIYGIYDMNGGTWEYVASYYTGGNSTYLEDDVINKEYAGSLYNNRNTKYVEQYSIAYDSNKLGDAMYETSAGSYDYSSGQGLRDSSWDSDSSDNTFSTKPVIARGGSFNNIIHSGIFNFWIIEGGANFPTFRPVLTGFNNLTTYTISFEENGGQGAPQSQYKTEGIPLTLSYSRPIREGYEFLGWSENVDATEPTYQPGSTFSLDKNTTLYAVYEDNIAPVITNFVNSSNGEWCKELTLSWDINETGSGIADVQWSIGNSNFDFSTPHAGSWPESAWYGITRDNERDDVVYIRAIDNAGNVSDVVTTVMKIDRTAPVISNFTNSSNGEWCKELTLSWDIEESWGVPNKNGSGLLGVQWSLDGPDFETSTSTGYYIPSEMYGITRNSSRNDHVYIRAIDNAGNISNVVDTYLKIDNVSPTGSGEIASVTDTAITFKATATDTHSGLDYLRVGAWWEQQDFSRYFTNSNFIEDPTNGTEYTMTINFADIVSTLDGEKPPAGDCTYYFHVLAYDKMGNCEWLAILSYNKEAKRYTIAYDANGGTGAPASQIKTEGIPIEIPHITFEKTGYEFLGWSENADATEATYTAGSTYTLDKDTTLYAVYKDTIAPEIYDFVNSSNGEWCRELTLSWNIKEEGSGISGVQWSLDGPDFETSTKTGYYIQSEQLGIYRDWERDEVVYIRAIDKAGNISNVVSTAMRIDRTAPVISNFTNSSNGNWCKELTLDWDIEENGSGISGVQWSLDGPDFETSTLTGFYIQSEQLGIYRNGSRNDHVYIRAIDKAGNISNVVDTLVKIDNNGATGSSSIESITDTTITFKASATDTGSGLSYLRVGAWWGQPNWSKYHTNSNIINNPTNGTEYTMSINFADIVNTLEGSTATGDCTYYFDVCAYDNLNNFKSLGLYTYEKEAAMYTVDYNANGGTGAPNSQTKTQGVPIDIPTVKPTRTGYDFLGWSTSSTATSVTYQPGATFTTDANTTLYAVWRLKTVKAIFHINIPGLNTTAEQTFTYGTSGQSFSNKNWTRAGYTLLGWSLTQDATASTYSVLSSVADWWIDTYSPEVHLYAVWKDQTAPVISEITNTSNGNWCKQLTLSWTILEEGSGVDKVQWSLDGADFDKSKSKGNYSESEKYGITRSNTREDVVHVRVIDKAGNISNVVSTTMKIDNVAPVISNITNTSNGNLCHSLTLSWSITENHSGIAGVQWSLNNSNFETSTNKGYYSQAEQLGITRSNTRNDTVYVRVIDNVGNISNVVSTKMNINSAHTGATQANGGKCTICNAVYKVYVSYDANGGSGAPATQEKTVGTALTISDTKPTRTGYTFEGWNTSSTATTATYKSGASYTTDSSTKLYAVWKANTNTVTLNNQGATTPGTTSVTGTYGSAMPAITKPTRANTVTYSGATVSPNPATATYTFGGYYTEAGGKGTQYYKADGTSAKNWDKTANTTLYAKWTGGSITLPTPTKTGYTFAGWYKEAAFTNKVGNGGASYTPTANVTLYAKWTAKTVKVTFYRNQSSSDTTTLTQTFTYGASNQSFSAKGWSKTNSHLLGWNETRSATAKQYATLSGVSNDWINTKSPSVNLYAVWEAHKGGTPTWNDKPKCSVCGVEYGTRLLPKLPTGLTPVNWNGSTWVATTTANWDYNYTTASAWSSSVGSSAYGVGGNGTAKWANAILDANGDGIAESLYVWIPRFTYKVVEGNKVSWNSDTAGTARTYIKFSNGTTDDTSDGYVLHSAFNPGGTPITGFWIAKYETSRNDATQTDGGTGTIPTSVPGKKLWQKVTPSDAYNYAKDLNGTNTAVGAHMLKNSEWGAVAYLTSAIGRIPYVNPVPVSGYSGLNMETAATTDVSTAYAWNTEVGVRASTTHNVYGVYDMVGGSWEYVAAVRSSANSDDVRSIINANAKYKDTYTETSLDVHSATLGWDGDTKDPLYIEPPAYRRGGNRGDSTHFGIFYGRNSDKTGETANKNCSFRVALFGFAL